VESDDAHSDPGTETMDESDEIKVEIERYTSGHDVASTVVGRDR